MTRRKKTVLIFFRISISTLAIGYVVLKLVQSREAIPEAFSGVTAGGWIAFVLAVALLPLNLGIEAWKWNLLISPIYPGKGYSTAVRAVLAGMAAGIFTPNRLGEYAGRVLILEKGSRLEALVLTFFDRICQMFITLMLGIFSFVVFSREEKNRVTENIFWGDSGFSIFLIICILGLLLVSTLIIFPKTSGKIFLLRLKASWAIKIRKGLEKLTARIMMKVLGLSLLRYGVFTTQYCLLLFAFGWQGPLTITLASIALIFLGRSIIPALGFTELGIREGLAIFLMGLIGISEVQAFNSTFILYLINILAPSAIGAFFLYGIKLEGRESS